MRKYVHILAILSIVLALASPACKFISGQMIEICAADGSLKSLFVPADQAPPSPDAPAHKSTQNCDFCLLHAGFKALGDGAVELLLYFILISTVTAVWIQRRYRRFELTALSLRGPPLPV